MTDSQGDQGPVERIVGYRFKFNTEHEWDITTRLEYVPLALQGDTVEADPDLRGVCQPLALATRVEELEQEIKDMQSTEEGLVDWNEALGQHTQRLERALGEIARRSPCTGSCQQATGFHCDACIARTALNEGGE